MLWRVGVVDLVTFHFNGRFYFKEEAQLFLLFSFAPCFSHFSFFFWLKSQQLYLNPLKRSGAFKNLVTDPFKHGERLDMSITKIKYAGQPLKVEMMVMMIIIVIILCLSQTLLFLNDMTIFYAFNHSIYVPMGKFFRLINLFSLKLAFNIGIGQIWNQNKFCYVRSV